MNRLDGWLQAVSEALDVDVPAVPDRQLLLDAARDAAHAVARPAAPLTTFLLGLAAARAGAEADQLAQLVALVRGLADRWSTGTDGVGEA